MTEKQVTTHADRSQMEREELAHISREARDMKLDTVEAGKSPVYRNAAGDEVGPNGRPIKDGKELPPGPGELS